MGIVSAIKAFFGAIGALFGFLDRKQLMDAGEAKAANKQKDKTLETLKTVNAPITDADRNRVRKRYRRS